MYCCNSALKKKENRKSSGGGGTSNRFEIGVHTHPPSDPLTPHSTLVPAFPPASGRDRSLIVRALVFAWKLELGRMKRSRAGKAGHPLGYAKRLETGEVLLVTCLCFTGVRVTVV